MSHRRNNLNEIVKKLSRDNQVRSNLKRRIIFDIQPWLMFRKQVDRYTDKENERKYEDPIVEIL